MQFSFFSDESEVEATRQIKASARGEASGPTRQQCVFEIMRYHYKQIRVSSRLPRFKKGKIKIFSFVGAQFKTLNWILFAFAIVSRGFSPRQRPNYGRKDRRIIPVNAYEAYLHIIKLFFMVFSRVVAQRGWGIWTEKNASKKAILDVFLFFAGSQVFLFASSRHWQR